MSYVTTFKSSTAKYSILQVWKGLPNLGVELDSVLSDTDVALAHGVVRGTTTGRLYGAPLTIKHENYPLNCPPTNVLPSPKEVVPLVPRARPEA